MSGGDPCAVVPAPISRPPGIGPSARYGLDLITHRQRAQLFALIAHVFPKGDEQSLEEIYEHRRASVLEIVKALSCTAESPDDLTFRQAERLIDALTDIIGAGA